MFKKDNIWQAHALGYREMPIARTKTADADVNRALQSAIFNSANFSSIATDAKASLDLQCGRRAYAWLHSAEVTNAVTPADISDPDELIRRAKALSFELGTPITPGFDALVFKASRGIEDIYELTYIRKDGTGFRLSYPSRRCATSKGHHRLPADWHRQHRPPTDRR